MKKIKKLTTTLLIFFSPPFVWAISRADKSSKKRIIEQSGMSESDVRASQEERVF